MNKKQSMPTKKRTTKKAPAPKEQKVLTLETAPEPETADKEEKEKEIEIPGGESDADRVEKYFQSVGRRKESIARVRLFTKKAGDAVEEDKALISVNGKDYSLYFTDSLHRSAVESPLRRLKSLNRFKVTVHVAGGGLSGQAGAIKHGIARALERFDQNFRKKLKKSGYLTRDPRAKERRKYGLKKARKSPQWQKR